LSENKTMRVKSVRFDTYKNTNKYRMILIT
jgi:hypothetical protein